LTENKSILGGEGSGHIICLDKTTTGDGIVAALQVLAEMQRTGKSLHELKSGMKKYPQVLINVRLEEKVDIFAVPAIQAELAAVEKALGNRGRVLLRASGTEPLVRVMVEGVDQQEVEKYARQLADCVKNAIVS
jgi:phosphoglucosamine mutase